jgi:hypothetical protein
MQVVAKDKYENIDAFMVKVADDEFVFENNHDQIVYKNSSSGCTLEMFTNNRPPQINGEIVDLRPELVFDSPYLISEYGSAVITIKAPDGRKKVLDLNY